MCRRLVFLCCLAATLGFLGGHAFGATLDLRIDAGGNDAEEHLSDNSMDITSSDLEFPYEDNGNPSATDEQLTLLRFVSVPIPKGTQIVKAYLEFEVDETKGNDKPVNVVIEGQLTPSAPVITSAAGNLSSRAPWTAANVKWTAPLGLAVDVKFQSPDLAAIIQEIVNQDGWASGNALALAIRDDKDNPSTGLRCVESFEGEATAAPLLHVEISIPEARSPDPADGAQDVTSPMFQWVPGDGAVTHQVYMGTAPNLTDADKAGMPMPVAMYFHIPGLVPGTTYYWRVDEIAADGTVTTGKVWSFTAMPVTAHVPTPANGALLKGSEPPATLSWTAGLGAASHDVYLGTDQAAVAAGDAAVAVSLAQAETTFALGALEPLTTYYWRVDEHDAAGAIQAGPVWNFRVTDKDMDKNTDNWTLGAKMAGAKYLATLVADGVYDIGTFGGEQTYEFVVRSNPAETEASMCLIGRRDFGDTQMGLKFEQWNNTGTYGATVFGVKDYDFGVRNTPGEYTHLAFVASAAAGTTELYVNGVLQGSVAAAITLSGPVGIGYGAQNRPPAAPYFDNFDGDIFGVAIYDRALSANEIAANADKYFNPIEITDPDLLIYYDFETGAGDVAVDQSGHSNHGTLHGAPAWATGILGGCLSLNSATGDYVETTAPLNIVTNHVTVSGWVKHDVAPTAWSGILTHRGTSPGCLGLQHDGTQLKYMWGADQYWQFNSGLAIPNGEWYFAAVAISPTQGKLYLNGVDQTATNVAEHVPTNLDGLISVGRDIGFGTGRLMTAMIDDVRFYNRTLTDVDIQRLVLADVTSPGDAIQPVPNYEGCSPAAEPVTNAIDGTSAKKYLNFANSGGSAGKAVMPTGLQVTPAVGATVVTGLTLTTANDDYGRDPIKFELSGSNDSIDGPWTPIAAGDVTDFAGAATWPRFTSNATAISFANAEAYQHYQLLFTAVRDPAAANSMQIGEIELLGLLAP